MLKQGLLVKRPIQSNLHHADLFALLGEELDGLLGGLAAAAHQHDHPLGVGGPDIIEEVIRPGGELGELVHLLLDDPRTADVVGVDGLSALEIDIGVLAGSAEDRLVGVHAPPAVGQDQVIVDHLSYLVDRQQFDLVDFAGRSKAIEEVHKGHSRLQRGRRGDQGHVHRLPGRTGGDQAEPGLPDGHHVAVVAEDAQRLAGQRPGRDVKDRRRQLAGDLVHARDHQHQPLAGGEGRRQRAGLKCPVHGRRSPALRLHLHDQGDRAEDILFPAGRPLVGVLAHGTGGRDRIDCDNFVNLVGHVGYGLVAVHHAYVAL